MDASRSNEKGPKAKKQKKRIDVSANNKTQSRPLPTLMQIWGNREASYAAQVNSGPGLPKREESVAAVDDEICSKDNFKIIEVVAESYKANSEG